MRIRDVFLLEAYYDELQVAIMDRLAQYLSKEQNEIPTDEFRMALADDGFMLSFDEMKAAMEKMGAVANIDDSTITPKGKIPDELADPEGQFPVVEPDVSDMAGDQAMSAVKDQLPQ